MKHFIYIILFISLTSCFSNKEAKNINYQSISEIINVIKNDDIVEFNKWIPNIKNIDTLFQDGDNYISLLGYSSQFGSIKIANRLIELNASIQKGLENDLYSLDAIGLAVQNDNTEVVKLLIQHNADVNSIYDDNGLTPLIISCKNNNYEITKLLIESGANVDGAGDIGGDYMYIPLFESVTNKNYDITKLLIEHGAKKDIAGSQGILINDFLQSSDTLKNQK